jgi:hypothetical protein
MFWEMCSLLVVVVFVSGPSLCTAGWRWLGPRSGYEHLWELEAYRWGVSHAQSCLKTGASGAAGPDP